MKLFIFKPLLTAGEKVNEFGGLVVVANKDIDAVEVLSERLGDNGLDYDWQDWMAESFDIVEYASHKI